MLRGIIIGSPKVGKTTMLCNFCDVKYIEGNMLFNKINNVNNTLVRYNLWDFNSKDGYGIIKPSKYFSMPDFIIIMFDISSKDTFDIIPELIEKCILYNYDFTKIRIYLLGNKITDNEQVTRSEAEIYAEKIHAVYFEVDMHNLNYIFNSITNYIYNMNKKEEILPEKNEAESEDTNPKVNLCTSSHLSNNEDTVKSTSGYCSIS